MATNMPPHNLTEIIDATVACIDNENIDIEGLMKFVKAPDFPTGGIIYGYAGVKEAFETGRGRIVIRAKAAIETDEGREKIVVTEIPYLVNKAELIGDIAALAEKKKVEGIFTVNDESDREGIRIVIDVKQDANSAVVLNQLFEHSALQSSFDVNNIALVKGRPCLLNLKELIHYFVEHREEVVTRRTQFELTEAEKRVHLLEGFKIIPDNMDEILRIIRDSTSNEAPERLMERFGLSNLQACAVLKMRFPQLANMEQDLHAELKKIEDLKEVLSNKELIMNIIKEELLNIKNKYRDTRRTEIV
jgi:DNA gyrase subunit A